jgi:hypothetical protein
MAQDDMCDISDVLVQDVIHLQGLAEALLKPDCVMLLGILCGHWQQVTNQAVWTRCPTI